MPAVAKGRSLGRSNQFERSTDQVASIARGTDCAASELSQHRTQYHGRERAAAPQDGDDGFEIHKCDVVRGCAAKVRCAQHAKARRANARWTRDALFAYIRAKTTLLAPASGLTGIFESGGVREGPCASIRVERL